ncbi:MAG: Arc family DNA-binding protein [Bacteroidales bacterium]|nr:Arc family DNA-binding protein [Bacteroidales bacterium]
MTKKKSFVLRINPTMMEKLEKWAADEFRSVNGQIEWILHNSLKTAGRSKDDETEEPTEKNPES